MSSSSIDPQELAKFDATSSGWWDTDGPMAALHKLNPARLAFLRDAVERHAGPLPQDLPLRGRTVLDVGCGGGVLAEPLARLGGEVTGIDLVERSLQVARQHARNEQLEIDYRLLSAEDLAAAGERFDLVVASEVLEHVDNQETFVATLARLTQPDGLLVVT
ncbi:MAG: bifunctional 2-polyprenyl-6-hydroxyphenol methylase/3-demethylubiquinol 3-O-methyltransferase UbiG, partial [Pseudomonadota bacterium]